MTTAETPPPVTPAPLPRAGRSLWRRLFKLAAWGLVLLVIAVAVAPSVLPSSYVAGQVAKALANKLKKPVSVESARFSWRKGLQATGIRIEQGDPAKPGALFAKADTVSVSFSPTDLPAALTGGEAPIDSLRLEGFECWIAVDDIGRAATPPAKEPGKDKGKGATLGSESVHARSVQVTGGSIHVQNRRLGRTLDLADVNLTVGELATTGRGYLSLTAALPGPERVQTSDKPAGNIIVTATLNNLDFAKPEQLAGSLKAEWREMAWAETLAVFLSDADVINAVGRTSGRLSISFGRAKWNVEGAVEATDIGFTQPDLGPAAACPPFTLAFDRAILGFQLARNDPRRPIDVGLVRLSARGANVQMSGTLLPEGPKGPVADLRVTGSLDWAPLAESFTLLRQVADRFEVFGGGAQLNADLKTVEDRLQVSGTVNLAATRAIWPEFINKESGRILRADFETGLSRDLSRLSIQRLEITGEAGRLRIQGRLPLLELPKNPDATPPRRPTTDFALHPEAPGPSFVHVQAEVRDMKDARVLYPVLNRVLGPIETTGPLEASVTVEEQPGADGQASTWAVRTHADLTQTTLAGGGQVRKKPDVPAVVNLEATVAPARREADLSHFDLRIDETTLVWSGLGRVRLPAQDGDAPTGSVEGEVSVRKLESASAAFGAGRVAGEAPPLAGSLKVAVRADLENHKFRGMLKADLAAAAINLEDVFQKPAGQAASASLDGTWEMGDAHKLDGALLVKIPLAEVLFKGAAQARFQETPPPAKTPIVPDSAVALEAAAERRLGEDQVAGLRHLTFGLARDNALQIQAEVEDLARVAEFSPLLAKRFEGAKMSGPGRATLVLAMGSDTAHIGGSIDLGDAAVEVPGMLLKPRQMPLRLAMQANLLPPRKEGLIRLQLETLEATLDQSQAAIKGWVEFAPPASLASIKSAYQAVSLLSETEFELTSKCQHRPEFRKALPWIEPFYRQFTIEGETLLVAEFGGTPTRGHVGLGVEATSCRFVDPQAVTKPKGTPATLRVEASYGEVPGELSLDKFDIQLADAGIKVTGRVLFDDPRLSTLAPPSAWNVRAEVKAPNVEAVAALFPAHVAALRPAGSVEFLVQVGADRHGVGLEQFELSCNKARMVWLGRPVILNGKITYNGDRLATEGLGLQLGVSDMTLVAYISHPDEAPTGSLFIRGKTLDIKEVEDLISETHAAISAWAETSGVQVPPQAKDPAMGREAAQRVERFVARAQVSGDIKVDHMHLPVTEWNTTYDLEGFTSEVRLAGNRFTVLEFHCGLNDGDITGQVVFDFRPKVPSLVVDYNARNLKLLPNLKPFIDTTFPGMKVYGTLTTRVSQTVDLLPGATPIGEGETILTEGILEGPGAPEYITNLFPGLALTQYPFRRMSNVFRNLKGGVIDNRMIFVGKNYDVFIFGTSTPEKTGLGTATEYTVGIDLSASLGSTVWSRDLDQGKIPLMHSTGRIIGPKFAEQNMRYVLPYEVAWDVFVRRNLMTQLIRGLGEKPPEYKKPPVGPTDEKPAGR